MLLFTISEGVANSATLRIESLATTFGNRLIFIDYVNTAPCLPDLPGFSLAIVVRCVNALVNCFYQELPQHPASSLPLCLQVSIGEEDSHGPMCNRSHSSRWHRKRPRPPAGIRGISMHFQKIQCLATAIEMREQVEAIADESPWSKRVAWFSFAK